MKNFTFLYARLYALTILCVALLVPVITRSADDAYFRRLQAEGEQARALLQENQAWFQEFQARDLARTATPRLIKAVEEGNVFDARKAISDGADVNAAGGPALESLLSLAARANNYPMVQLLLDKKADPNRAHRSVDVFGTPLMIAMSNKHIDIARALLDAGANSNAQSKYGGTVLSQAAASGVPDIVTLVLNRGAQVAGEQAVHALLSAVQGNNEQIVKILLDAGVSPFVQAAWGSKMLSIAKTPKIRQLIQDAIDRGFFNAVRSKDIKKAKKALDFGADIKWVNTHYIGGYTPFLLAVQDNDIPMVKMLLEAGANPNDTSVYYGPALQMAKTPEMKRLLEDAIAALPGARAAGQQVQAAGVAGPQALVGQAGQEEGKEAAAAVVGGADMPPAYQEPLPPSYEEVMRLEQEAAGRAGRPVEAGPAQQEEEKEREAGERDVVCAQCTFANTPGSKKCEMCEAPLSVAVAKPAVAQGGRSAVVQGGRDIVTGQEQLAGAGRFVGAAQEEGPAIGAQAVACQVCTYENPRHRERCEMCNSILQKKVAGPPGGLSFK